jgi:hypothetical protein
MRAIFSFLYKDKSSLYSLFAVALSEKNVHISSNRSSFGMYLICSRSSTKFFFISLESILFFMDVSFSVLNTSANCTSISSEA